MNKTQVAAYVTEVQKQRLQALADMELCSLSSMLTKLIDESYELNFGSDDDDNDETEHLNRGEF